MKNFEIYTNEVIKLKKDGEFDVAWKLANKYLLDLVNRGESQWYMMYYQMADILAREKKWKDSLEKMAFVIHYSGRVGGITHKKFIERSLFKLGREESYDKFVEISLNSDIVDFDSKIDSLLG